MAENSQSLLLDALARAAAEPRGLPLLGAKGAAGLFATSAAGKEAAQRSKSEGYVCVLRQETKGKGSQEICVLTEKGLNFLLEETNPRRVLEALVSALEACHARMTPLLESTRACQEQIESLKAHAEKALEHLHKPQTPAPSLVERNGKHAADAAAALLAYLRRRHEAGSLDDCSLPELYHYVKNDLPNLSIGEFHDLVARLREDGLIYLHPWTGPLYELPEPVCALFVGHEVAYYASLRKSLSQDTWRS